MTSADERQPSTHRHGDTGTHTSFLSTALQNQNQTCKEFGFSIHTANNKITKGKIYLMYIYKV